MPHGRVVWKASKGRGQKGETTGGHRMDGMFRMGKPHGFARVYDHHENVIFEGRFINGRSAKPMPIEGDMEKFRFGVKKPTPATTVATTTATTTTTTTITTDSDGGRYEEETTKEILQTM